MKINTKLLLAFLSITLIPLATISLLFYYNAKETLTHEVLGHLESVAAIQQHRVAGIVEQNLERLSLVSSRTQLRISLSSFINNPNAEDQDKMNSILLDARSSVSSFQSISVLTLNGKVVASTDKANIGVSRTNDEVFARGQTEGTADTFFINENQELSLYLSGPLYIEGQLLGVVIIESAADNIVSSIQDYTGLGETGETILAGRDENGDAVFLVPTRFDAQAALSRVIPQEELDSPVIQALLRNEKLLTGAADYRGKPVLAATRYIESTGWGLVTKIDQAEALAPVTSLRYFLVTVVLLSLALILLTCLFLSRAITRPITKLSHMAVKVSKGDLNARAEVTSRDEIGVLAQACNQMKDSLLKTNSELERELAERKRVEGKYSTLVERGNDGIIIIQEGMVKFANSKMVEMTGFSLDEAIGKSFIDFVAPEYKESVIENYRGRLSGEAVPNSYEIELLAKNGSRIPVEINASRIEYEGKSADMAIVRDITERKRADNALRQSEERYRDLFDNANDLIQSVAPDGRLLYTNKAWQNVLGYGNNEIAKLKVWDIIHPDSMNHCAETFQRVMSGENASGIEAVFVAKDGSHIVVEGNAHAQFVDGKPVSTQGIFRDVTERKQREERIAHLSNVLLAVRNVNQLITREKDRERLIQKSCDLLIEKRSYIKAWILLLDENRNYVSAASAGLGEATGAFLQQLRSGDFPGCVQGQLAQETPLLTYLKSKGRCGGCTLAGKRAGRAVFNCKLEFEGKLYGILGVTVNAEAMYDEEEQDLFSELCGDIAFALATIEREGQREQAVTALLASEERYRTTLDGMLEGCQIIGFDWCYRYLNDAAVQHSRRSKEELLGHTMMEMYPGIEKSEMFVQLRRCMGKGVPYRMENLFTYPDGSQAWFELSIEPMPEGIFILSLDITERKQAEEALRRSEEKSSAIFRAATDGILLADIETKKFYDGNKAICQMTGYNLEEIKNLGMMNIHPEEDLPWIIESFENQAKGNRSLVLDIPVKRKDGSVFYADINSATVAFAGRTYLLGMFRDATKRRKAEEEIKRLMGKELQVSREWQETFNAVTDVIILLSPKHEILRMNRAGYELAGKKPEELLGRKCWEVAHGLNSPIAGCPCADVLVKKRPGSGEITQNGRHYLVTIWPVFGEKKEIVSLVHTVRDITESKQAEEKIRLFSHAVAGAVDAIVITDMKGTITYANPAMREIYGYRKDEMLGKSVIDLNAEPETAAAILSTMLEKGNWSGEVKAVKKNGEMFPALLSLSTVRDDKGKPMAMMGVNRDITERKRMEEQLVVTNRLASIGELASGIAHELNNPLTGVIGLSQLLTQRDVPEDIKEDLDMVYSEAQRAASVVKNLLTFARKHSPVKELISVNDVIHKVLELRAYEQKVSNIVVLNRLAPDLPRIMADNFQLQQVFLNIVINAEYFMTEAHGKGTLTITTERTGDMVRISFADDGPGIPREHLGHIFDPFFTTKEVGKGTGLGLSICHGIVTAHGGQIYIESGAGKGATFIVELPIRQEEQ